MIFPDLNASELTILSSLGKNIDDALKKIENKSLRELLKKMSEWNFKDRFSIEESVNFIEK
jgi:hypothetical protein